MKKMIKVASVLLFAFVVSTSIFAGGGSEKSEGKGGKGKGVYTTPASTVADQMGFEGEFPYQFELDEFEKKTGKKITFNENPEIASLNAEIKNNPQTLPPVGKRLPEEPLVLQPWNSIGKYGGVLNGISGATESGTSDLLSIRHVNLFRYHDDYQTIKPDVAKSWKWNSDYTELLVTLRKGHKWSNGEAFTAEDIEFWYNDLILNENIYAKLPGYAQAGGEAWKVEAIDDLNVKFTFAIPFPGFLSWCATTYVQPFQPKHFLSQYHIKYNSNADKLAKDNGFDKWVDLLTEFYGASDWKDVPTPLLKGSFDYVTPTLEAYIVVSDTPTGRKLVPNPFFHQVDTVGNQLPYISRIDETYVVDFEVQNLKITRGDVTYKAQGVPFQEYPLFKENESRGDYTAHLAVAPRMNQWFSLNTTVKDPVLRKIFNDVRFRQAMSLAINRDEINNIVFFEQGKPQQWTPAAPGTVSFITEKHMNHFIEYDPERADKLLDQMGLSKRDNEGNRLKPDGSKLNILLRYTSQDNYPKIMELVRGYWSDIGIDVEIREVTTDEYRMRGNNNDSDMTTYGSSDVEGFVIATDQSILKPPFGGYFDPGTGIGWAEWMQSDGKTGIEPPSDAKKLFKLAEEFKSKLLGTEESNKIGKEITDIHINNLWKIGTVGSIPGVVIQHNSLSNFQPFTFWTASYRTYAYRPTQWFINK